MLAWLANACAFTDLTIDLPAEGFKPTTAESQGRLVLVDIPFADGREIRDRCGMKKNGANMDTADIFCRSDPSEWIAKLLADQLRASGFDVLDDSDTPPSNALRIDGTLTRIFTEPVLGGWTTSIEMDLSVTLRATTATGLEARRNFFVKGWRGGQVVVVNTGPTDIALSRATQALLDEMVLAISELLDRYPEVGAPRSPKLISMLAAAETRA